MAYRSPMLLHEYAHFIKQTIFPSDMLAVISTLRAAAYTGIGAIVMLICIAAVKGGLPWTVIFMPLIFIPLAAFLMGLSWFLSAIGAFTRDAGYLMINIVPLFMFADAGVLLAHLDGRRLEHPDLPATRSPPMSRSCATSC